MKLRSIFTLLSALLPGGGGLAFAGPMTIDSLDGPVTANEIASFKTFMQARTPSDNNVGNDWVYGDSGKDTEALGLMFEVTRDPAILDQMIRFADAALACRNDPVNGRIIWTGKRELCWPNKRPADPDAAYSGSENGDVIAHIGYCAELILRTPALWTNVVAIGDPRGYGTTYKARALKYVAEMDRSIDTFIVPWFVRTAESNHFRWPDSPWYRALGPRYERAPNNPIPWNQQTMLAGGFLRLANCHRLLGDAPSRVARNDGIVQSNLDWFFGDATLYRKDGHEVYDWGYHLGRHRRASSEDVPHGGYDIWGLWRAWQAGRFGVTRAVMDRFANTLHYVIWDSSAQKFRRRVGGTGQTNVPPTASIGATWISLSEFSADVKPDLYHVVAEANRVNATTRPLEAAFILFMKHQRHQDSSVKTNGASSRGTK